MERKTGGENWPRPIKRKFIPKSKINARSETPVRVAQKSPSVKFLNAFDPRSPKLPFRESLQRHLTLSPSASR